mgnify:CR=1 FL=1
MICGLIITLLICSGILYYGNKKLSELDKRIDEINFELDNKIQKCKELADEDKKVTKNLVNATNKLKMELDKTQQALTVFNNGFDGIQSTM